MQVQLAAPECDLLRLGSFGLRLRSRDAREGGQKHQAGKPFSRRLRPAGSVAHELLPEITDSVFQFLCPEAASSTGFQPLRSSNLSPASAAFNTQEICCSLDRTFLVAHRGAPPRCPNRAGSAPSAHPSNPASSACRQSFGRSSGGWPILRSAKGGAFSPHFPLDFY